MNHITTEELTVLVRRLSPSRADAPREEWARVIMAIKNADDSEAGFQLADEFSRQSSSKYDPRAVRATWKSVNASGGVTVGSLIHWANEDDPDGKRGSQTTKRGYQSLADYAEAHHSTAQAFRAAGWSNPEQHWCSALKKKRPALAFTTATGKRWRYVDGQKPTYDSPVGYNRSWYRLAEAIELAKMGGSPLVICNGEASAVVGQAHGYGSVAIAGGSEKPTIPEDLLAELQAAWSGEIVVALDCDKEGRTAAPKLAAQLRAVGYRARAVDLGGTWGFDWADYCGLHNGSTLSALRSLPELTSTDTAVERPRFSVRTVADLASIEPPRWALQGELIERGYHLIYGASGGGKTFYAIDRSLRLAAAGKHVLYIATEDLAGLRVRVTAWRKAHPFVTTDTFAWLEMPEGLDLADQRQADELMQAIQGYGFDHITIDTLREAHTGDENSSQDGAAVNRAVQALVRTGASVDVVHHSGVEDKRPRGTTAVFANADMVIRVGFDGDVVTVHTDKVRNAAPADDLRYVLTTVETGLTDDVGNAIYSAVLRSASADGVQSSAKLTRAHRTILGVLAYSIFEETGAKAQQIQETTDLSRRTIYQVLSELKTKGYIVQGSKGDPYTITSSGRAQLSPSAEVQTASQSPSAASADEVQSSAMHPSDIEVQVVQVQGVLDPALHCTSSPSGEQDETPVPLVILRVADDMWELRSTEGDGTHLVSSHRTEKQAQTQFDKCAAAWMEGRPRDRIVDPDGWLDKGSTDTTFAEFDGIPLEEDQAEFDDLARRYEAGRGEPLNRAIWTIPEELPDLRRAVEAIEAALAMAAAV